MLKCRTAGWLVNETTISSDRETSKEEAVTKPVNNICISNDYEIVVEPQKELKTYEKHVTTNKQTFLLTNCKHWTENKEYKMKLWHRNLLQNDEMEKCRSNHERNNNNQQLTNQRRRSTHQINKQWMQLQLVRNCIEKAEKGWNIQWLLNWRWTNKTLQIHSKCIENFNEKCTPRTVFT